MEQVFVRRVVTRLADVVCESPSALLYEHEARTARKVADLVRPFLEDEAVEVFVCLLLNGKQRVVGFAEVSRGTLTASLVHPREVFGPAIREGAAAVIVTHNHPSGDPEPSAEDLAVTERLTQAGEVLGVPLLDHVIIGSKGRFLSLRERLPRLAR